MVSPHFDDAVFSAARVLLSRGRQATVLTVCGGAPPAGVVSEWDLECGYRDGAAAAADRAREDLAANEITGAASVHLGLSDAPYRDGFPVERAAAELAPALPASGPVWVPAGIGSHPDHVGTREATLSVPGMAAARLRFYADCPYAWAFGWDATDGERTGDHRWQPHLDRLAGSLGAVRAHLVYLDDEQVKRKLQMVACHASQVRGLLPEFPHLLDPDGPLRREVYWTVA